MNRRRAFLIALTACSFVTTAVAHPIIAGFERFHGAATTESQLVEGGLLLLNELNCVACHAAPEGWRERLPGRGRIGLNGVGSRLGAQPIADFVADPAKLKPGTTMPRLAHDAGESEALAAYLTSLPSAAEMRPMPAGDAKRGQRLFESVGCAACHVSSDAGTNYASVPIGLAAYSDRNALASFLQDPLRTRPAGRMPKTELTDAEAADLAAYLSPTPTAASEKSVPREASALGHKQFVARNCAACHDVGDAAPAPRAKPLNEARPGAGCLAAETKPGVPAFSLSDAQTRALASALRAVQANPTPPSLTAEQRVTAKFEQLNCYACHEWRGRGGVEPARAKFFTATDSAAESLGELGHLPPKLDLAGRKLTAAWLEKLLWGRGGDVRPYLTARMPQFGKMAAGDLVPLLAEACRPAQAQEIDTSGGKGHQRFATGRTLLGTGTGGLGCVACHGIKEREPQGVRAINLTHTAQRLRPEYFKALLLDPQGIQPGTIMPPLLTGRKAANNEIESIWTYFKELDQSNVLPEGLAIAGSFELKPEEDGRPIVFRTFLEGAGTQAIAVGFPVQVHAAFDAFEVRWALVWRGRFVDAQSNWEERPMKPIKPLGDTVRSLPNHQPFARLRDASEPWPAKFGRYAGYVFKGYRLDREGTPTFRYEIGGLQVEDTLRPSPDGASLRRTLKVRRTGEDDATWFFRGIGDGVAPQPVVWKDRTATIEETILF